MTRFARIRGSNKPSFNKVAEDATPWEEMKKPVEDSSDDENNQEEQEQIKEEPKELTPSEIVWAEFEKPKKNKKSENVKPGTSNDVDVDKKNQKHKKKNKKDVEEVEPRTSGDIEVNKNSKKLKRKNKKDVEDNEEVEPGISENLVVEYDKNIKKHKKNTQKIENNEEVEDKDENGLIIKEEKSFKRRKPDQGDIKISIDGQDVGISRFDGFYVLDHDAKRLHELRKKLQKQNLHKDKIKFLVTKERRIAEKALARRKKKVCFQCRRSGHNLTECPEIPTEGTPVGVGICFKCGSTEHSLFQCRVPGNELKFATCFICKEQGHLSKNCPDNPRGLYPEGGGCRNCGDVTHLKQDCPKGLRKNNYQKKVVTVNTFKNFNSIDDDYQPHNHQPQNPKKHNNFNRNNKPKKIIFK